MIWSELYQQQTTQFDPSNNNHFSAISVFMPKWIVIRIKCNCFEITKTAFI